MTDVPNTDLDPAELPLTISSGVSHSRQEARIDLQRYAWPGEAMLTVSRPGRPLSMAGIFALKLWGGRSGQS